MWQWLQHHAPVLDLFVSAAMALVWIIYLNFFLVQLRRQRRTEILIHLAGRQDASAVVLVSNLGFEPVAVQEVLLTLREDAQELTASVSEEVDPSVHEQSPSRPMGPLTSGHSRQLGTVDTLFRRFGMTHPRYRNIGDQDQFTLTVAVTTAASTGMAAASQSFSIFRQEPNLRILPTRMSARQIRSRRQKRQLQRQIDRLRRQ